MEKPFRILVAENDDILAKSAQEFMELQGYTVFTADTPEKAKAFLENNWVHLAIVDMRLQDENSSIDKSGIDLLKTTARQVPKLIWTAYTEEYVDVVEAMKPDAYRLQPAVNFVAKRDGLPKLGTAVAEALAKYMPLNKTLQVAWARRSFLSFPLLVEMVTGDDGRLPQHSLITELEDLFCLLFQNQPDYEIAQITVNKVIISGDGYVILGIYAFKTDGTEIPYIVTFGKPDIVKKEAQSFKTTVPRPIRTSNLSKSHEAETTHFAATAYRLVEGQLDTLTSFATFYGQNEIALVEKSLNNLFNSNLVQWYKHGRENKPVAELEAFYKILYQKKDNYLKRFQKTLGEVCQQMRVRGLGLAEVNDQQLRLTFSPNNSSTLSNPLDLLKKRPSLTERVHWGRIHGTVGTKTILVDHLANTWLIDFTQVGPGPVLHDFTHLETQIKMQLLERHSLEALYEFEQKLEEKTNKNMMLPSPLNKALRLILALRQQAALVTNCTGALYQLCLYYQGLNQFLLFDEVRIYTQAELQPFVHLLLSTSMIASSFLEKDVAQHDLPKTAVSGLFINEEKRQVYVNGKLITNLSTREYQILLYFKQHEGQTRSRKEIVLEAFKDDTYDEFTDRDRVNNAIKRLREKIEPDPQNPRFIITISGQGYQFNSRLLEI